uniref:Uncharacterized protein n=1 Tax=Arundo donax TaxID=35708 RepID=A0A0A9AZZ6_ARUDO
MITIDYRLWRARDKFSFVMPRVQTLEYLKWSK